MLNNFSLQLGKTFLPMEYLGRMLLLVWIPTQDELLHDESETNQKYNGNLATKFCWNVWDI